MSDLHLSRDAKIAIEETFIKLKPVCDQIAISPTVKSATELKSVLETLPSERLQQFVHYILIPIFLHLSNSNKYKSDSICSLLDCLHTVLKRIEIKEINLFLKVFVLVFSQVLDEKESNKLSSSSEELKLGVMKCAATLIKRSELKVLSEFYTRHYYGKLSMSVYTCTRIALKEESIHLKEEALRTLIYLIQVQNESLDSYEFRHQVANIVMLMLPGIVSHSLAIATATDIQNHKITLLAVRLWGRVVGLVMEDNIKHDDDVDNENAAKKKFSLEKLTINSNSREFSIDWSTDQTKTKDRIQRMSRSSSWIEYSNNQLMPVTKAFAGLQNHQHWKVRLELVNAAHHILTSASKNMCLSLPSLIEILIILSQDEQPEVSAASLLAIKLFSEICELRNDVKSLVEIVEDSLYELITKLPRILYGIDLTMKERQLSLLSGYLDILGRAHVNTLLSSAQHLHRLLSSLFIAAALDCSSVTLLEEVSLRNLEDEISSSQNGWRKFKWCNTQTSQHRIEQICRKLVKYSNLSLFIHYLLDNFNSGETYRKEITLIFNYIFASANASNNDEIEAALSVFNSLMDQNLWNLPVGVTIDAGVAKEEAQNNIVQVCLLTETVSSLASFVGADIFSPLLLRCLYPLLECAGSPLHMIATRGLKSVNKIAELYGGGVGELMSKNADYLSHHVLLNLRHAHRNPRVLSVLSVIMEHSTFSVLPSLHEIINDVLVQCCDSFQNINAGAFLQVFHTFILCLNNWCGESDAPSGTVKKEMSIVEELLDYQKTKQEAEQLTDDESEVKDISGQEIFSGVHDSKDKTLSNHIKLTVQILNTSLHFLPSKDQTRQIVVLQILENGVLVLRKWTDELLPIVHKIWSPLVQRFKHCDNHLIMQRAFSLLKTLSRLSREFIRARTLRDVLPCLLDILKRTAKDSLKNESDAYKMSQKYKLQLCLLNGIGELSLDMDLTEKEIDTILETITPYLSNRQPQTLQDSCFHTFKLIANEFCDLVWLHLMSICPKELQFEKPSAVFPVYQFQDKSEQMKEYKKNVHRLLDII